MMLKNIAIAILLLSRLGFAQPQTIINNGLKTGIYDLPSSGSDCLPSAPNTVRICGSGNQFLLSVNGGALAAVATAASFVPYTGATADVNLGIRNLSTSGNVSIGTTVSIGDGLVPVSIKAKGAKGDWRTVADAAITAASHTLTSATAAFTTADTGKLVAVTMGPQAVVTGTYTSGITATGAAGTYCALASFNGGGSGASARVYLTGTNTIAGGSTIYTTPASMGTGYTSAPTSATASSGTATCSGTATVTTSISPLPVLTTATYVNATTVTLVAAATATITSAKMSISTDDTVAIQSAITTACASGASVYIPPAKYGINGPLTIPCGLKVYGDGVSPHQLVDVPFAPWLDGTVIVQMAANTDAVQLTGTTVNSQLYDFGIMFDPTIAYWQTGHGFNAIPTPGLFGLTSGEWANLAVWGTDGNHYAYLLTETLYHGHRNLKGFGGGGLAYVGTIPTPGNSVASGDYFSMAAGGTADCYYVGGAAFGHMVFIRPQCNMVAEEIPAGASVPTLNLKRQQIFNADSTQTQMTIINPDLEVSASPINATFPNNATFTMLNPNFNLQSGSDAGGIKTTQVLVGAGSVATPPIASIARPTTGIYIEPTFGHFTVSVNGVTRFDIDTSSNTSVIGGLGASTYLQSGTYANVGTHMDAGTYMTAGTTLQLSAPGGTPAVVSQPSCNDTAAGKVWYSGHTAGVKDSMALCAADAANAYAWRTIY